VDDPHECVVGADAVVVVTEWPEYVGLDWGRVATLVRRQLVVDGRNCLSADPLVDLGFTYIGVGRPTRKPKAARTQSAGKRTPDLLAVQ
jgi:UDPglucose 6-dehydrogenase